MITLGASKFADFDCPRKFYLRNIARLEPVGVSKGIRRGKVWANALEYASVNHESPDLLRELEAYIADEYTEMETRGPEEGREHTFEMLCLQVLVAGYLGTYGAQGWREIEYESPLYNPQTGMPSRRFSLRGRIDGLWAEGETAVIVEDKLVSQIQGVTIEALPMNAQLLEYVDILAAHGFRSVTVDYRMTRFPSIGVREKQGETVDQFVVRLADDVKARPEFYFVREVVGVDDSQLAEYRQDRWQKALAIGEAMRTGNWYRSTSRCRDFGRCSFLPLCSGQLGAEGMFRERQAERREVEPE